MHDLTKIKVCGLTNLEDARFASGLFVDYLGFIFYEKSPRFIDPAKAGAIINWLEGPKKVGVFVNQPLDEVNALAKETGLDLVQLHGEESVEYCSLVEKPVIKVFHITAETIKDELEKNIGKYKEMVDFFLFDTKIGDQRGGTGQTFDWDKLHELTDKEFFLSGGLNANNVGDAIQQVNPYAVDVSSGIEEEPGLKDLEKMEKFVRAVRPEEFI